MLRSDWLPAEQANTTTDISGKIKALFLKRGTINVQRVSFCFFCDGNLWCQVARTVLQYFQRYRLFRFYSFLVAVV